MQRGTFSAEAYFVLRVIIEVLVHLACLVSAFSVSIISTYAQ